MIRALYSGTTGMRVQQHKMDSIGNNIANASTVGFKRSQPDFKETLYDIMEVRPEEAGPELSVGNGVRVGSVKRDFSQGNIIPGGNLDFAIDGTGFFAIGLPNGEDLYTRDGGFRLSHMPDGRARLDNREGYPVLNENGNPIFLDGDTREEDITLSRDGDIFVEDGIGNLDYRGRLGIYSFMDPEGLEAVRSSYYAATEVSGAPMVVGDRNITQGRIEMSNVSMSQEMTDLIIAQRAYQMNSRVIQTADDMEKQASSLRG